MAFEQPRSQGTAKQQPGHAAHHFDKDCSLNGICTVDVSAPAAAVNVGWCYAPWSGAATCGVLDELPSSRAGAFGVRGFAALTVYASARHRSKGSQSLPTVPNSQKTEIDLIFYGHDLG